MCTLLRSQTEAMCARVAGGDGLSKTVRQRSTRIRALCTTVTIEKAVPLKELFVCVHIACEDGGRELVSRG